MPKKTHFHQSNQTTLAGDLSAPLLWRNNLISYSEQIRVQKWHDDFHARPYVPRPLIGLDTIPFYNDLDRSDNPYDNEFDPNSKPAYKQKARFYSDKIVIYPVALNSKPKTDQPKKCLNNLTRGSFKGFISKNSGLEIRKRLEAWIKCVNVNRKHCENKIRPKHARIVFITLTLPSNQVHSDNEIKRSVLMPFIQQLKRVSGVEEYFWAAEPQENDNIHFHVLADRFVRADLLNDLWNTATNHLGYLDQFIQSTGSTNPPSTRINECPPDMSLVKYVLKYVSKQPRIQYTYSSLADQVEHPVTYWESEEIKGGVSECNQRGLEIKLDARDVEEPLYPNRVTVRNGKLFRWYQRRPIEGRSWGMSKGLTKLDVYSEDVSYRIRDIRTILEWDSSVKFVQKDHCEIFYCNSYDILIRNDKTLAHRHDQYYLKTYRNLYLNPDPPSNSSPPIIQLHQPPPAPKAKAHQTNLIFALNIVPLHHARGKKHVQSRQVRQAKVSL